MVKTYTVKNIKKFVVFCNDHVNENLVEGLLKKDMMEVSVRDVKLLNFSIEEEILQANYQCNIYNKIKDVFIDSFEFAITLDYQVKIKKAIV